MKTYAITHPEHFLLQGAPIKNNPEIKFIISVTVIDFVTKFTGFTEEDSGHICSIFHYNK